MTLTEKNALEEFVIVIDTRESAPYKFIGENCVFSKLDAGDYSVKGFEKVITFERKTHQDFIQSVTHSRKRFKAEMERMKDYKIKAVVVESDFFLIAKSSFPFAQKVNPESVIGSIVAITVDYGIPIMFWTNRERAQNGVLRMLKRSFLRMRGIK